MLDLPLLGPDGSLDRPGARFRLDLPLRKPPELGFGERLADDTDGRAGRKSLELILGIYESAKTGREVPLPLRAKM